MKMEIKYMQLGVTVRAILRGIWKLSNFNTSGFPVREFQEDMPIQPKVSQRRENLKQIK